MKQINYERMISGHLMTECPYGKEVMHGVPTKAGSIACQYNHCGNFVSINKEEQTVTCKGDENDK